MFVLRLLILWLPALSVVAQETPYLFSTEIQDKYSRDSTAFKNQFAAWAFSYIGDYENSLKFFDSGKAHTQRASGDDSLYFASFRPVKAREFILREADSRQIIIINEAHHQPLHRVFTASLLPDLYNKGFRYFCAETLDLADSLLNRRKYPLLTSGYYLKEPQYAYLIRLALGYGYHVVPYDYGDAANGAEREMLAARNIKKIIEQDPKAKIIIHCGFDHIREDSNIGNWNKAMAGRLKEYTSIDPLTIDQVRFTETSVITHDNPLFKTITIDYTAVFIDSAGRFFNGPKGRSTCDIRVFHPRTTWHEGRPAWLYTHGRKPFQIYQKIQTGYPCLVMAYAATETEATAIPLDVIELKNQNDHKALVLPVGEFKIIVKDTTGKQQRISIKL